MDWATRSRDSTRKGNQLLVIEDLVSTGKSSLQVADVLRKAGLNIVGMVSIFSYGFAEASQSFEQAGVRLECLTDYETLIALAIEKGIVSSDQQEILLNWRTDPANWKGV